MDKFLISILTFTLCFACQYKRENKDYYVISYHDSITSGLLDGSITDSTFPPPPPPFPQSMKWYSNVVIIFDSTDMVYIYQTETRFIEEKVIYISPGDIIESQESKRVINFDTIVLEYNFPNYIGLKPEHLIAVKSEDFIDFIELNNDIFQLDTINQSRHFFFAVSNKDTIVNEAFYELDNFISKHKRRESRTVYLVRKTTEEENYVIYNKRHKTKYDPEKLEWKSDFINKDLKPFTNQYNLLENRCYTIKKAKETFEKKQFKNFSN